MSKVMTRPMPLSNIPAPSLISFTFAYPADEWWSYSESYVVMETKAVRGMLENGRVDPNRVLNAEVLATGRAVDVTR